MADLTEVVALLLTPSDVTADGVDPSEVQQRIVDTVARAVGVAPCVANPAALDEWAVVRVRAVLRAIVNRSLDREAVQPGVVSEQAGPFSRTTKGAESLFWPSELTELQSICRTASTGSSSAPRGAFPEAEGLDGLFARRPGWRGVR